MIGSFTLLAQSNASRTYFELMRLRQLDEWWHWLVLVLVSVVIIAAVTTLYFFDSRQLARGKGWLLLFLRIMAFVGLLVFFLDLQKRTEQKIVKNSRFAVLVDASQSMGIADQEASTGEVDVKETRMAQVVRAFGESSMLNDLRQKHDVTLYRFDETNLPTEVASFGQLGVEQAAADIASGPSEEESLTEVRALWKIAMGLFAVSLVAYLLHLILGNLVRTAEGESWALLASVFALIVAVVFVAVSNLRHPEYGPRVAFGWKELKPASDPNEPATDVPDGEVAIQPQPSELDWVDLLEPAGGSTRLGDAINWVIARERGTPLAGIAVITDGNSNRGVEPVVAAQLAKSFEVPIYPVGIASELPPTNVRLVDLEAPARVYPGDEFKLTGFIQAYGMQGKVVDVRMVSRPAENPNGEEVLEWDRSVELGPDGTVLPIPMQVTPDELGKRIYTLEVADGVDQDTSDNQAIAKVQIVDRKSRILLLAGGPTREYRFARNMLHRDKDVSVDVLLQTAKDGVSQEADDILFDLPLEPAQLFEYDAIVAFDPDWRQFDRTQLDLLEQWVAEKAGGLVCIAGPVHTPAWAEDRRASSQIEVVRQLYPVTFSSSRIQLGRYGSEIAWPLNITEDGRSVSFLSISDDEADASVIWGEFPGLYGYYPIRAVKPAATVYARYSDPQVAINDQQPPLIVGQFYGSGRVVFLGSGEFWRLRAVDEGYFERFYTKLIRFVSEGRLLRDSNRGLLLVDKERALRGDSISIRATVVDQQFQPLRDPTIRVTLRSPDGSTQKWELGQVDAGRDGMYGGQFIAGQPGDYQLQLVLPGDGDPVILEREVRVTLPNLEIERPQRNDPVLRQIAAESNGRYFVGLPAAMTGDSSLAATVISKRRETFLPGTPDRDFQRRLMSWLLGLICGVLCLEWLVRRLSKLA